MKTLQKKSKKRGGQGHNLRTHGNSGAGSAAGRGRGAGSSSTSASGGLGPAGGVGTGSVGVIARQRRDSEVGELGGAVGGVDLVLDGPVRDGDDLAGGLRADAVVDQILTTRGDGRQGEVVVEALLRDERRVTLGSLGRGRGSLSSLEGLEVDLLVLSGQVVVVDEKLDRLVVVDLDDTIVVVLLAVLVDETAGEDGVHVRAVDRLNLGEDARGNLVAAKLREEDGHRRILQVGNELVVGGRLEAGFTAPGVGVEAEEVGLAGVVGVTVLGAGQVVEGVDENGANVSSGVADGNLAVGVLGDVVLQVTGDGAQVRGDISGSLNVVHNLVAGEEGQGVGVVLESLDDGEGAVHVSGVVAGPGLETGDTLANQGRVDVEDHVHASGVEDGGASIVVQVGVQVVDTDGVGTETLEEGSIAHADISVAEGILVVLGIVASAAANLVVETNDLELLAALGYEGIALDGEGLDGSSQGRTKCDEGRVNLLKSC